MQQFYSRAMVFAPSITTVFFPNANNGLFYASILTATGGRPPYSFALISGILPTGLSFNSSGLLSGVPSQSETVVLTFKVTDSLGIPSAPSSFSLTVTGSGLNLIGETLPSASPGSPYSQNISGQASGGVPPYTFSLVSSTGSDTWFVSSAGVISGTPGSSLLVTETGNFLVTDTGNGLSI
jgi:hypothetical protein